MRKKEDSSANDQREARRLRAWELHQAGWSQNDIARELRVSPSAVSQWIKLAKDDGPEALRSKPRSGRPAKLNPDQLAQLKQMLGRGPAAYGPPYLTWYPEYVTDLIEKEFGVTYSTASVRRIMHRLGW